VGQILGQIGQLFNYIITEPIFNVLMLLYHLFGNMALSIIVLTLIVRLALFPLTLRQLKSTKATQAIQPLIADVKKKYKDQKEQYQAMQAIYKEYGVNPVAGCLPLLVQLPVLYGLFFALREALNTANANTLNYLHTLNSLIYPFLPKFIIPPDPYMMWFGGPINLGHPDPTHILPILAGLATFLQLRMSQPRNRSGAKDAMSQQMAIMQYVMPFVTFFFALNFAAGLALYWTTTSVFSMVQQYFVTGWGSLAVMPAFLQNLLPKREINGKSDKGNSNSKTYSGDKRKETQLQQKANEPTEEVASSNGRGKSSSKSNASANGSSSARRRTRNNSASARRRGNTPKRNVSRS
jgi:YidC/Oxa1 family membrane protein insertase